MVVLCVLPSESDGLWGPSLAADGLRTRHINRIITKTARSEGPWRGFSLFLSYTSCPQISPISLSHLSYQNVSYCPSAGFPAELPAFDTCEARKHQTGSKKKKDAIPEDNKKLNDIKMAGQAASANQARELFLTNRLSEAVG